MCADLLSQRTTNQQTHRADASANAVGTYRNIFSRRKRRRRRNEGGEQNKNMHLPAPPTWNLYLSGAKGTVASNLCYMHSLAVSWAAAATLQQQQPPYVILRAVCWVTITNLLLYFFFFFNSIGGIYLLGKWLLQSWTWCSWRQPTLDANKKNFVFK